MSNFPFDYDLPPPLIAQEPCFPRDHARLLVARRGDRSLHHHHFFHLPDLLQPGDLLVLNDTRVLPARLLGKRARTGGRWEGLFLRESGDAIWEMLCQTRGTLNEGEIIEIEPGPLTLRLQKRLPGGRWEVEPLLSGSPVELLDRFGHIPLPPYIRKGSARAEDRERYQTIYAQQAGAIAAPTAGLHFTERVFDGLQKRGIAWTTVTLHVGLGTFQPIQADDYTQHPMHAEWGQLSQATVDAIDACKKRGGRVVAVGTTSVRVLESVARLGPLQAWAGETELFIHSPYDFKIVDALVTNFHLPKTTLLLLVAAFAGADLMRQAYETAMSERYRFYSYGDAMLILPDEDSMADPNTLDPMPTYTVRVHRLDPTLAELRIEFADLPSDVQVVGRLMGPRCQGGSTIEIAYPLRKLTHPAYAVLIPEPIYWDAERQCVYEGPVEFHRDGKLVGKVMLSCGVKAGG